MRVGIEVEFLEEAFNFLNGLGEKEREKVYITLINPASGRIRNCSKN